MNQISWPIDLFFLFSGGHFIASQAVHSGLSGGNGKKTVKVCLPVG